MFVVGYVGGWWLPKDVSTYGWEVDLLFYGILYMTGFFFVLTEAILVYNLWKFYHGRGQRSDYVHGSHRLEILWTAVTAVILLIVAFSQVHAWENIKYQTRMPEPDQVFEVSARQFEWRIRYPARDTLDKITTDWREENKDSPVKREPALAREWERNPHYDDVDVVNEVHVWKMNGDEHARVRLFLKTRDVLHSFFLPNLRIKQDAVPGKTIPVWFEAKEHNIEWDGQNWVYVKDSAGQEQHWDL